MISTNDSSAGYPVLKSSLTLNHISLNSHPEEVSLRQTQSSRSKHDYHHEEIKVRSRSLPFIHRFITNWLIMDPVLKRKYQTHSSSGKNYEIEKDPDVKFVFFFGGRLLSIKGKPINIITGALIVIPVVIYCIFEAKWQWHHLSPAVVITFIYIWLLAFCHFWKAATSDAGMLPKNLHIPKSINNEKVDNPPDEYFNSITLPSYGNTKDGVVVKYLQLCYYQIGEVSDVASMSQSVKHFPLSLFLIIYSIVALLYPLLLLAFHLFLTSQNITTREYLNNVYKRKHNDFVNVFDTHSIAKNLYINWFGSSRGVNLTFPRDKYQPGDIRYEKIEPLELFSIEYERK
ncbi:Palmitoyltransferase ERF2 [Candida parapsilosis]|nr:Palmitoyltransferase ERF2 [Candida parapsilosis]KAI5909285.1 Palmitoyltransferase ERF2 [Candida parapsilosis]